MFAFFRFAFGNVAHLQSLRSQSPLSTYEREQNKKKTPAISRYATMRENISLQFSQL